ncbi:gamma-tubulin complex component 4 isoform X2 [Arctopsyche grandis]|uniref:gamma-tubulin complex component 4 isoform X2 n=1 Tax=Arctopsyche grandis TaxID=121162 RepID=UPI00406D8606
MIHDAILLLWEYHNKPESTHYEQEFKEYVVNLNDAEKDIFLKIAKIAKYHGSIRHFIKKFSFTSGKNSYNHHSKHSRSSSGLYIQALTEGIDEILEPYRLHIIELEKHALSNPHLPLSYILGSVEKFKFLLFTISKILSSIKEKNLYGCQILDVLQHHALSGNRETTCALQNLLHIVHRVFYEQLCSWMLYGDLKDPQKEFFIHMIENSMVSTPTLNTTKASSIHSNDRNNDSIIKYGKNINYEINEVMRPYYIPLSLAQKILFIGKSVVLFDSTPFEAKQDSCLISLGKDLKRFTIWGEKETDFHVNLLELKKAESFDVYKLDMLVDEIKSYVTEHLWIVAGEEAGVLHELQLMKDFYLLGRGELFLELLRLSSPLLNSLPNSVSTRDINRAFQAAARAVLLGTNKDVEKFSFDIPYNKQNSSLNISNCEYGLLNGWSTVVLKYDVKWPLHLIFTPKVLHQYNEIFRFLLRLKKVQHDLHSMWYAFKESRKNSVWQLHNKLMFLMDHLQHYLQADVLESNYSKLITEAEKIKDFELLKTAHHTFLLDIRSQAFLLMTPNEEDDAEGYYIDYQLNPVMSNIMDVIQLCDNVCSIVNDPTDHNRDYLIAGYSTRFDDLVGKLLKLLTALSTQPCGMHLARLLMRLDFNRWFSSTAHLTQSVSCIL